MLTRPAKCVHHFSNVVATLEGEPSCRSCGRKPTPDEEAAGIKALVEWEKARNRARQSTAR